MVQRLEPREQESQRALLQIEQVEASRAAIRISQFVESMTSQVSTSLHRGLDLPFDQRQADYRAQLEATEGGLLRRAIFSATRP